MNTKILNELRKLDFDSDIEKSISDTFFEGEDKRPYPLPRLGKSLDLKPLANHINKIWSNYFEWWNSDNVQEAVNEFCNNFAYINRNKIKDLKKIIIDK